MNSKQVGDISEISIMRELITRDVRVSKPIGDNYRYDLIVDINGELLRIQCKTGRKYKGCIIFDTCSSTVHRKNGKKKSYDGEIDYFAVYYKETNKVYILNVDSVSKNSMSIRIEPCKNGQIKRVVMAADCELDKFLIDRKTLNIKSVIMY